MPGRPTTLLLATTLLGFATVVGAVHARNARQSSTQEQPPRAEERARLLAKGKELFVERCSRCHNERGDRPLKTGPPLNERGLASEAIARAVSGRLRDRTEEERHAVTLYISSLMKPKDSEDSAAKP